MRGSVSNSTKELNIPYTLIQKLRSKNVYLFAGAGLSMSLGYPSWDNLLIGTYQKMQNQQWNNNLKNKEWLSKNFGLPDWSAEVLEFLSENNFRESLSEVFNEIIPKNSESLTHALISLLPFKGTITTNFDTLLEDYLKIFLANEPTVFTYSEIFTRLKELKTHDYPVYKIHGCIKKDPKSVIITTTDYYNLLHDQRYIRFLDNLFSKNVILTIGYSLRDRDFRAFVEERQGLHRNNNSEMYCIVGESETCDMEVEVYRKKYNIHLIPVSEANSFSQITSLLLDMFCLVYQVDPTQFGQEIIELISLRQLTYTSAYNYMKVSNEIEKAGLLLSVFKEPVDFELFTTICVDAELLITPAHLKAAFSSIENKIINKKQIAPSHDNIAFVANWLANYFNAIPLGDSSRYLSVFHKRFLRDFINTISFLLSTKEGWKELIGDNKTDSILKLRKFNEFFRQEGKWQEWLNISTKIEKYLKKDSDLFIELMKTKMWVFFWTRRFEEAKKLLIEVPEVNESDGQYSYKYRLSFMENRNLSGLIKKLEDRKRLDLFNKSLLGRCYARLAVRQKKIGDKKILFSKSKKYLKSALTDAYKEKNNIEISVQSWYLGIVLSEIGDLKNASNYLADSRRLDEGIMDRKPGLAWLKLGDYRLAKSNPLVSLQETNSLKQDAINAMSDLGIIDPEIYIETDFLY